MTEEPKTSPLEPDQFKELFGEHAKPMTPEQARRQLCQHHGVAAMDDEIEALNDLARKLGTGFEAVLVEAKRMIDAMDHPSASALHDLYAPQPGKGYAARSALERAIHDADRKRAIEARSWALTRPRTSLSNFMGRFR